MRIVFPILLALAIANFPAYSYWQSRDATYNLAVNPAPGFQGPGDVLPGALAYWLTYSCYTSVYSGLVADIADGAIGTVTGSRLSCDGAGNIVVSNSASACTFITGNACSPIANTCSTSCGVVTLYDQSGANTCGGASCDVTQAVASRRPTFAPNALNTTYCGSFVGSMLQTLAATGTFTQSQPFTIVMVSERTAGTGDLLAVVRNTASGSGTIRAGYTNSANKADIYSGGSIPGGATASDNHFHQLTDVFSSSSGGIYVDGGSLTTLNLGNSNGFSSTSIALGELLATSTNFEDCEAGLYNGSLTSGNANSLTANAVTRYGTFP